jgi:serine/threonine-protein kinase
MSPEQVKGKSLDHRTDLYSVGVMIYECATGVLPFVGHAMSVMGQHIHDAPKSPQSKNPEISSTLESLILALLEKHPSKRPASANVVALALIEEAERALRLERINPGLKRSEPRSPLDSRQSRTPLLGQARAEHGPANGFGRAVPGSVAPSATEDSEAALHRFSDTPASLPSPPRSVPRCSESAGPPPSAPSVLHRISESAGPPSSPTKEPPESFRISRKSTSGSYSHPVARDMLTSLHVTPIVISPEERYLCGHYLAYLLGGSRRQGLFLRRPLDARNSDRARLLLAMAWLSCIEQTDDAIARASKLLEDQPDVRAALSPVVVIKYLASRDTFGKRKRFRRIRKRLQDASPYANATMRDANGVLNPGMMPRTLDDLATIAPPRDTLDAHRVSLWNRIAEVWREEDDFRRAILRYATRSDHLDAISADLWPEVVYPLIERAHWQRTFRPRHEALWDYVVAKLLRFPLAGVRLDRMMQSTIPAEVAEQLDQDLFPFVDDPQLDEEESISTDSLPTVEQRPFYVGGTIPRDERPSDDDTPRFQAIVPLVQADPFVFTQNVLRSLWEGAIDAQADAKRLPVVHRTIPVGPYKLAVIPTVRGVARSAVRAVLQGMPQGKQIEIITPLALTRNAPPRTVIAIWTYQDASIAIVHLDFQYKARYILWHAPDAHQLNFDYADELRHRLDTLNLEVPDQLDLKEEPV